MKPKIPKDAGVFYENRKKLEDQLTSEFSVARWKTNSIIIQALIEG